MPSALSIRSKLNHLEREMEDFAKEYHFMNLYASLERKEKDVAEKIRAKDYPFFKDELEDVLKALKVRIDTNSEELGRQLIIINKNLLHELRQASYFTQISQNDDVPESTLEMAERETNDFARKLKQGKEHYFSLIDPEFEEKMKRIDELFKRIEYYFTMRDEASFEFKPNEKVVMADKAEWVVTGKGKEDPDGILFLTDQRILFEQKETTGKFLGIFGGKKQHGLQWEYSIQQIANVSHKDEGMFKGKDMLSLDMQGGAEHSNIELEVKGRDDNSLWAAVLEKAIAGKLISSGVSASNGQIGTAREGDLATVVRDTEVFSASDVPTVIGTLSSGTVVKVGIGPHMGRIQVTVIEGSGSNGWVSSNTLAKNDG